MQLEIPVTEENLATGLQEKHLHCAMAYAINKHPDCKNASIHPTHISFTFKPDNTRFYYISPDRNLSQFVKQFDFKKDECKPGTVHINLDNLTATYVPNLEE